MAHNNLVRNPATIWIINSTILNTELLTLDGNLASIINGDDGGTWAPLTPITIQGQGLSLTGPLVVARGGSFTAQSPQTFQFFDNDYPLLGPNHVGRSRTAVHPCLGAETFPSRICWFPRWTDAGMQSMAPMVDMSDGQGPRPTRLWVPIRAHDGATLSSITVNFRVGWPHTALPSTMPGARVIAVSSSGVISVLTSQAAGADANGFVYATKPGSAIAYTGNQTITVPCDQNNAVSIANFTYYVEIVEEQGLTGYPWALVVKQPVRLQYLANLSSALSGPQTVDFQTANDGDRILVNVPGVQFINGIWVAHAGVWARAPDLQAASDYTPGMLVPVMQGNTWAGTFWQASTAITSWNPGTAPTNVFAWITATAYAVGAPVVPSSAHTNGFWYQATAIAGTGTSGGTEPHWPTTIGQSVVDNAGTNQITWTCMGPAGTGMTFVPRGLDDSETPYNAGSELLPHGNIFQSVTVAYTGITQAGFD